MLELRLPGAALAALAVSAAAHATPVAMMQQSGGFGDLRWEARSMIVGMTPTRDATPLPPAAVGGGDPIFLPALPRSSGLPALIMDYGLFTSGPNAGLPARFICTGSKISSGFVLTAAHCVSPRVDTQRASPLTTAYFYGGGGDIRVPFNALSTPVVASAIAIHPGYTGQVIDDRDIALLRLGTPAPSWAQSNAMLLTASSLRGEEFNVFGYGNRSIVGGGGPTGGATGGTTGFLRQGENKFDYRMGDPIFSAIPGNGWQTVLPSNPNISHSYISDFDSGNVANSQASRVAQAANLAQAAGAVFTDTGVGALEVSVAGGDSGGPSFVNGKIATVTSYGLSFGPEWGDCRTGLQSSCGELNGFVPLYWNREWLLATIAALPTASSLGAFALGLGLVGLARLRRRGAAAA